MNAEDILLEAEEGMDKSVNYMTHEFSSVRTGKASPALVENVDVEAYGSNMKLKQLALITTPEPRLLVIQPFDAATVKDIERGLKESKRRHHAAGGRQDHPAADPRVERGAAQGPRQEHPADGRGSAVRVRGHRRDGIDGARKSKKDGDADRGSARRLRGRHPETHRPVHQVHRRASGDQGSRDHEGLTVVGGILMSNERIPLCDVSTLAACSLIADGTAADGQRGAQPRKRRLRAARPCVHPAPDFAWIGAGGKTFPAKNFRGQPVVILVAPSPDASALRKQAARIEDLYLDFSARRRRFSSRRSRRRPGRVESNVPYAIAQNGAAVAAAYGVNRADFAVIVIGPDGNVDMVVDKVEGAQRILDIINNTYQTQAAARAGWELRMPLGGRPDRTTRSAQARRPRIGRRRVARR